MAQVKWVQSYLNNDGRCNITEDGVLCNQKLNRKSYNVKTHVKSKHRTLFARITGQTQIDESEPLTKLAGFVGSTSVSIDCLRNPFFRVSV